MRAIILLASVFVLGISFATTASAQKAKFKTIRAGCQKGRLPSHYVAPEDRTYILYAKGAYADAVEERVGGIYGWASVDQNPALEAAVSIYGYTINPPRRSSQQREKKDKDGNVTERWTEYTYSGSAVGRATLYVYGEHDEFVYKRKPKSKQAQLAEQRRKEREEEEKADLADNPFLSAEDVEEVTDDGESSISEDVGLEDAALTLVRTDRIDLSTTVSTSAYRSPTQAYKAYVENEKPKLYDFRHTFPQSAYNNALNRLNAQYGFSPVNYVVNLREMRSDKHPEHKTWNDACQAAKALFKTFQFNQSIEQKQKKFDAIIAYFNGQVESIPDNDKKARRVKKAAFYNLANIMYYLDREEQLMTLCKQHEESKLLGRTANKMGEKAARQAALMAFHKVKSCHFEELSELVAEDVETVEDQEEGDDGAGR